VIALTQQLRSLGLEVWRDEEGSRYAPPISGSTLSAMAAAIEFASCVVVCVSPQYRESGNCRLEAEYAHRFVLLPIYSHAYVFFPIVSLSMVLRIFVMPSAAWMGGRCVGRRCDFLRSFKQRGGLSSTLNPKP